MVEGGCPRPACHRLPGSLQGLPSPPGTPAAAAAAPLRDAGDPWGWLGVNGGVRGPGHLWEKAPGRSGRQAGSGQLTSGEGSQREQAAAKRGRDPPAPGPAAVRGGRPPLGTPRASAKLTERREGKAGREMLESANSKSRLVPASRLRRRRRQVGSGAIRHHGECSRRGRGGQARCRPRGVAINADPHRCSEVAGLCQRLNRRQLPGTGRRRRGGGGGSHLSRRACHSPACQAQRAGERTAGQESPRWPSPERDTFQEFLFILSQPRGLAEERGEGGSRPPAPDRSPGRRRRPVALRRFWPRPFPPGCGTGGTAELIYLFLPPPAAFLLEGRRVYGQGGREVLLLSFSSSCRCGECTLAV